MKKILFVEMGLFYLGNSSEKIKNLQRSVIMRKLNLIVVFSTKLDKVLFCIRANAVLTNKK